MRSNKPVFLFGLILSHEAKAFSACVAGRGARQEVSPTKYTALNMQTSFEDGVPGFSSTTSFHPRDERQELRAVSIDSIFDDVTAAATEDLERDNQVFSALTLSDRQALPRQSSSFWESSLWQVVSAASLVTGNTVGAGMLVLPGLAAGPGMAISSGLMFAVYLTVLTSGLIIADVAICQHDSGYHVPSSFQEFAEANLDNKWIARGVSAIPVAVNSLVMVFAFTKAGELASALLSSFVEVDPAFASAGFICLIGACLSTMSGETISAVASMCVTALLVAFGGLLIPGLASVPDAMGTLLAPGTAGSDWMASVANFAPIVLTALQFQNIVPSLTKILKYDRTKTVAAVVLGSFVPLAMYLGWVFAVLGGGIDTSEVTSAGPLFTVFSASTLFGSSLGAAMSVTEEVEIFLSTTHKQEGEQGTITSTTPGVGVFGLPAVLLSLMFPVAGLVAMSDCDNACAALGIAGSFGAPLLYGFVPALMAWNQRRKAESNNIEIRPLVPIGLAGALGCAATVFVGEGLLHQVAGILS